MRILDLRPWYERRLTGFWRRQNPGPVPGLWDRLSGALTAVRIRGRHLPADSPLVVSVGNLSLGGSGKTPVVGQLAADLARQGITVGILTRGFRSLQVKPVLVEASSRQCGDEARLLAARLGPWAVPVVQAADRVAGFSCLLEHHPRLDVVILEDGFQTRGLGRHLDILIVEAWARDSAGSLIPLGGPALPWGPWREPVSAAQRADVWLVEGSSDVPREGLGGKRVLVFNRRSRLIDPDGNPVIGSAAQRWATVAGIAHPEAFEHSAGALMGQAPDLVIRLRDHEPYGQRIRHAMAAAMAGQGIGTLVTTAKDWIKLQGTVPEDWRVLLVVQDVVWDTKRPLPDQVRERLRGQAEDAGF